MLGNAAAAIGLKGVLDLADFRKATSEYLGSIDKMNKSSASFASKAGGQFMALGSTVLKLGSIAAGVAFGGIAALAGGLGLLILKTAATADELVALSDKTGISVERLQELKYIGDQTGTSLESVTGAMARLVRSMDSADKATSPTAEAFKKLGINVKDANGNMLDSQTVFDQVIDALGKIENPTERDAIAMALFGRSAQELNPLIKAGSKNLRQMSEDARKFGVVLSKEAIQAAADFNDKLGSLKMGIAGASQRITSAFIPILNQLIGKYILPAIPYLVEFATAVGQVITWLSQGDSVKNALSPLGNFLNTILPGAGKVLSDVGGAIDTVIKKFREFAANVAPIVSQVFTFLGQHMEEIKGALVGIGVVLGGAAITAAIAGLVTALGALISPIGLIIGAAALLGAAWAGNWLGIRDTLTQVWDGTIRPALETLWAWLQTNIPLAIDFLATKWEELKTAAATVWDWVQKNIVPILGDIWTWLQTNIPLAIDWLKTKWDELKAKLGEVWSWVQENLIKLFTDVQAWLLVNLPLAIDWLKTKWGELKEKMSEIWAWVQATVFPILQDLWARIQQNLPAAIDTLKTKTGELKTAFAEVRDFIVNEMLPRLAELKAKLDIELYTAAGKLAEQFNRFLAPAFMAFVRFSNEHLMPLLVSVVNLFYATINVITTLAGTLGTIFGRALKEVYDFIKDKILWAMDELGLRSKGAGEKVDIAKKALDGFKGVLDRIGQIIDGIKQKIDEFVQKLNDLANKIPDIFKPGSPSPFEIALLGIAAAAGKAAAGIDELGKKMAGIDFAGLGKIFNIGGGFGSFGSAIASRFQKQTLDPLKARLDEIAKSTEDLRKQYAEAGAAGNWVEQVQIMDQLNALEAERVRLASEYAAGQEKILALQKAQEDLAFLKTQMDFLQMIKENKLDVGEILGGLKLGLDADLPSLIEAMTRAIRKMVEAAQNELGAHSESKVFKALGAESMLGFGTGWESMLATTRKTIQDSMSMMSAPQPYYPPTSSQTFNLNMGNTNIYSGMDEHAFQARLEQSMARLMGG